MPVGSPSTSTLTCNATGAGSQVVITKNSSATCITPPTANCVSITAVKGTPITAVTMSASGGDGGSYTFSANGLPDGLVMSTGGTISGTPTVGGTFPYTVTVTDSHGNTGNTSCSVTVTYPPITGSCVSITAVKGTPITAVTMSASGGDGGSYTFSANGLPDGLVMSTGGTISGTPTVGGTFNYTVTITDKAGNIGTSNCSVTVTYPPITGTCVSIIAVKGTPITAVTMSASGGDGGPYTFSASGLPAGLTMDATGKISGTPTVGGTFSYTVTITDKAGNIGTSNCSVTVTYPPITGTCVSITAVKGTPITAVTMSASGGDGGSYTFSANGLPDGLVMSTGGTISGTPTVGGTFNYTVTITDKAGNIGTSNCSVTVTYPPITGTCISITAVKGTPITAVTMTASGGDGGPYTFSASGLPAGLTMDATGKISGTPTVGGTFSYTVTITDKAGNIGTSNCSVTVTYPPITGTCVSITAVKGTPITAVTMSASGGDGGSYTFSANGLPDGLVMSTGGTISGTPTVGGTFNYTVTITDKAGNIGTSNCSVTVTYPPITGTCVSIIAVKGTPITAVTMSASGGDGGPYTFSASGLPAGLTMDATGKISGTPTVGGTFPYTVTITDKAGNIGTSNCSVTVNAPPTASCISITAVQGIAITPVKLIASGGIGSSYTFTATGLPAGLSMAADGTISGTPTVSGTFTYTVTVKDKNANSGTFNCSVTVNPPPSAICVSITAVQGVAITPVVMTASGGVGGPYVFTATGLPAGITMALNGTISGTPTVSGTFTYIVTVTDKNGNSGANNCSIIVKIPSFGCTFTIGYWKNHAGFGPQADVLSPLLPQYLGNKGGTKTINVTTAKIAYDVLNQNVYGTSSNGITKLYAQLLAAKLNLKAGADPAAVASIITAADSFLTTTSYSAWATLKQGDQSKVLSWAAILDSYNNGVSGPGHCGSQESVACINLQKKISVDSGKTWLDADTQESAAAKSVPFNVLYKLVVNNCGTVNLTNVDVDDPVLGISNYMISVLPAGASTALGSSQIPKLAPTIKACQSSGAFENVATVTAVYNDIPVTASDSAWLVCTVTTSCLDIIKDISVDGGVTWKTADTQATAPGTTAPHSADYRLTVKNCGSTTLSNVQIQDSNLGLPAYSVGSLSAKGSKVYTYREIPQLRDSDACTTAGVFSNTALVSGTYNGLAVTDSDTAWLVCTGSTSGGCSYTWGYWKTHTVYDGAKKRNATWGKLAGGENALFFGLGQSWYNVLMTDPSGGNAYYILAHQYIAAYLNKLSGASVSVIDSDFKHAAELLEKYDGSPLITSDVSGAVRDDFITTASRLDQYNNGMIGPGHCK
ncbi:beta strand repeat-containing protein [Pelotalea chapellei]